MSRSNVVPPAQIAIIGDVHLHQDKRRQQRLAAWDAVIDDAGTLPRLRAWIALGDIFDARSDAADRNDAIARIRRMAAIADVLIVRGNHDQSGELDVFAQLDTVYPVTVFEHPTIHTFEIDPGVCASVAVIPYPHKASLVAMGIAPADVHTAADGALMDICRELAAELADRRDAAGDATFVIGHANISGAKASTGQPTSGKEISLTGAHLDLFGTVPKVFGHIHAAQDVHCATYAGSISANDWGECERKGWVILALGPGRDQWAVFSREIPTPRLWHVEGLLTRDGFTWEVTRGPGGETLEAPASWAGSEVRVRYRFSQSEKSALNVDHVRRWFTDAARLELEPVAIPDRALRAPAVVAARTLAEKVQAWAEHVGVSTSEAVLAKLARLEQSDPHALVREVEGWLRDVEQLESQAVAS